MLKDSDQVNIYDEVKSHAIYEMLTKDLSEDQRSALDAVIKEFSHHMQANVFDPAMETVMKARAAAAQQAVHEEAKRAGASIVIEEEQEGVIDG